jgi:Pyruvate/2-oxoacid:ferredoxin oxidoreductase delta subunit
LTPLLQQSPRSGYHQLAVRLNKFPQGAPPAKALYEILAILFSEREARLVSQLPIKAFNARKAAAAWGKSEDEARRQLNALCRKALLVDIRQNGETVYCLPPPMAGFFEFSMMRIRSDIDQKTLADLFYRYINVEEDFAAALFGTGGTPLGRVFAREAQITATAGLEVLNHERVSHVVRNATAIGASQCYCRHKMMLVGHACDAPRDICLTFNAAARALIRHGYARRIDAEEARSILQRARHHHLVQFGENVREQVNFICNCCKCCCDGMVAARRFAMYHPVATTNFMPVIDENACSECGQCARYCPVDAITFSPEGPDGRKARVDTRLCLGCGVCAQDCPSGAIALHPRMRRVITPLNTAHRVVLMAIERNTLQHIIFDNQVLFSHRALAVLLGVIFRLPPVKQLLACRQLKSRYLETIVERLEWQPPSA